MTRSRQEALIREAIAAEADQAVDHRTVLANLRGERSRRRPFALFAAVGLTVAAAAVAVVVPLAVDRTAAPRPADPAAPATGAPQTVLLIGLDGEAHADTIVLGRVGPDGAVSTASIPRDSWVDVPGAGVDKVSLAYAEAHAAAQAEGRDADAAGAQALVQVVESLTGVEVDHYAAIDMTGFAALSEAVGGVDVCLAEGARDELSGVDLPAGAQTLRGDQALAFLRQRVGLRYGDLDRVLRQQAFLRSLAAKVLGTGDPARLARVVEAARAAVRTDPGWDLLELARRLTPTVRTAVIPLGEVTDTERGQGHEVDPAAVRSFLAGFFADGATGAPTGGHTVPPPATGAPEGCVR